MSQPTIRLRYGPKALVHLREADPALSALFDLIGPFRPALVPDRFAALGYAIISQQISTKAAASIRRKVQELLHPAPFSATAILAQPDEALRAAGLSGQKVRYLRDLADKTQSGLVSLDTLSDLEDEEVIDALIQVKGIGRWTAEMFLIFSLGRPDVLPVDDLGLRAALRRLDGLAELPTKEETRRRGEAWKPYSSVATWYLWQSLSYPEAAELSVRARRLDIKKRRK